MPVLLADYIQSMQTAAKDDREYFPPACRDQVVRQDRRYWYMTIQGSQSGNRPIVEPETSGDAVQNGIAIVLVIMY